MVENFIFIEFEGLTIILACLSLFSCLTSGRSLKLSESQLSLYKVGL